jgi:hypothetical protein
MLIYSKKNVVLDITARRGVEVQLHVFLTSAVSQGEWSDSSLICFAPGERAHGAH